MLPCARRVLERQIDALLAGTARETPQDDSQATYFGGRKPEDGRIDWTQTTRQIFNLIRAVTDPYPARSPKPDRRASWSGGPNRFTRDARPSRPARRNSVARSAGGPTGDGALELTRTEWRGTRRRN